MYNGKILLVSMPWASNNRPSLSAGLLAALAKRNGFDCSSLYPTFDFAASLGAEAYESLAENSAFFGVSEHVFAASIFGNAELRSDDFLSAYSSGSRNPFMHLRDGIVPQFVDRVARDIVSRMPDIVGFTCTFNQVFASLAVARKIKETAPAIKILMGGACVHAAMGEAYARAFPEWLDHVFTGEADDAFTLFLERWRLGDTTPVPGVTYSGVQAMPPRVANRCFADPCTPDFDDWFEQRRRILEPLDPPGNVTLPFESSRGCWWGEKSHCTFCGLNNDGMQFRTKAVDATLRELVEQAERHRCTSFMAADNILDHRAFSSLLPKVAALGLDFRLFYEIKANVTRDKVAAMANAGVRWIQPGIESFSDHVLHLMRKGVTGLQNVALMRLAAEHGIALSYNILVGFPGEQDDDYEAMLALIPSLVHLQPPSGAATLVQVHRFSPFFRDPAAHGLENVRPSAYYAHMLPARAGRVDDFAYFFERDTPADAPVRRCLERLDAALASWRASYGAVRKTARLGPGFIEVTTTVDGGERRQPLSPLESAVLILADEACSVRTMRNRFADSSQAFAQAVDGAVERLLASGALVRMSGRVVSAVPFERPHTGSQLQSWLDRYAPPLKSCSGAAQKARAEIPVRADDGVAAPAYAAFG